MSYAPPLSKTARDSLCAALEGVSSLCGCKPSKITTILAGDAKLYARIMEGGGFTVALYDRVMGAVSAVWPDDEPWPEAVPRPAPARVDPVRSEQINALVRKVRVDAEAKAGESSNP